ncbi:hypothetical protein TWF506_002386 [Arthrobotrys conoides]|uniref:Uncharacterized protein n=1 Tax=Arthrobotrys conoides TaxID=74498 RepID=A0AAN8N769_9PEZI
MEVSGGNVIARPPSSVDLEVAIQIKEITAVVVGVTDLGMVKYVVVETKFAVVERTAVMATCCEGQTYPTWCSSGNYCTPTMCVPNGVTLCPGGQIGCYSGSKCCGGNKCIANDATCCDNGGSCPAGKWCCGDQTVGAVGPAAANPKTMTVVAGPSIAAKNISVKMASAAEMFFRALLDAVNKVGDALMASVFLPKASSFVLTPV